MKEQYETQGLTPFSSLSRVNQKVKNLSINKMPNHPDEGPNQIFLFLFSDV